MPQTPKTGSILSTAPVPELPRLLGHLHPTPGPLQQAQAVRPLTKPVEEKKHTDWTAPEVDTPSTPASEPAKVVMPGYECKVPVLDPLAPVKKRLPEWSL